LGQQWRGWKPVLATSFVWGGRAPCWELKIGSD